MKRLPPWGLPTILVVLSTLASAWFLLNWLSSRGIRDGGVEDHYYVVFAWHGRPAGVLDYRLVGVFCLVPALIVTAALGLALYKAHRARQRSAAGLCPACGYNLSGNISGVCPECGTSSVKNAAA